MDKTRCAECGVRWFQRFIWIGIAMNMVFAIPALFWPDFLNSSFGLPSQAVYPWLQNAGMLLVGVSLFTRRPASAPSATRCIPGCACCPG